MKEESASVTGSCVGLTDVSGGRGGGRWMLLLGALVLCLSSCASHFPQPREVRRVQKPVAFGGGGGAVERVDVWVVADPLHTGLVVPLDWLEDGGFRVPNSVKGQRYVNVSWGDRVAYEQERWLNLWEVFNALVIPSESVVEIIGFQWRPRDVFPRQRIYQASVPRERGADLAAFLNHCGRFDEKGRWLVVGPATWGKGNLLASGHSYGFPRLCNAFTAASLESCGYRFGPWSEIWADAMLASCERQGFKRLPDLSEAQILAIEEFSRKHPQ